MKISVLLNVVIVTSSYQNDIFYCTRCSSSVYECHQLSGLEIQNVWGPHFREWSHYWNKYYAYIYIWSEVTDCHPSIILTFWTSWSPNIIYWTITSNSSVPTARKVSGIMSWTYFLSCILVWNCTWINNSSFEEFE